jgi:hypothetical protein
MSNISEKVKEGGNDGGVERRRRRREMVRGIELERWM